MACAELAEPTPTQRGQPEPDDPLVVGVGRPPHQSGVLGPIDQPNGAVVPEQQGLRHVTDRGAAPVPVPTDREQELMLRRREADGHGLLLAPVQEAAQAYPELE